MFEIIKIHDSLQKIKSQIKVLQDKYSHAPQLLAGLGEVLDELKVIQSEYEKQIAEFEKMAE